MLIELLGCRHSAFPGSRFDPSTVKSIDGAEKISSTLCAYLLRVGLMGYVMDVFSGGHLIAVWAYSILQLCFLQVQLHPLQLQFWYLTGKSGWKCAPGRFPLASRLQRQTTLKSALTSTNT